MKVLKKIALCILVVTVICGSSVIVPTEFGTKAYAAETDEYQLAKKTVTVYVGESDTQKLLDSSNKKISADKITWKSSNKSIAKISDKGKITGVKAGQTKMTAKYDGKTYSFTVKVKSSAVKLSKSDVTFGSGTKSAKVKVTTSYSRYGLTYSILSGSSNISCSWAKNWSGNSIYLNIKSKKAGTAKIKVWVTGYPSKSRIITVNYDRGYSTCYEEDNYKIGQNMPAGEYVVFSYDDSGYVCISEDSNQNNIIENENFEYNTIIQVRDGDYLEISRAYAVPIDQAKLKLNKSGSMYKVGYHIEAGEYRLERTSDYGGYYAVLKGPVGSERAGGIIDNIIDNDNFDGSRAYVTVENGQYLQTSRCKGNFVAPENPIELDTPANYSTKLPTDSNFTVSLPYLPYVETSSGLAGHYLDAKVNEIEVKKMYDAKSDKYACYCTAYGSMTIKGIHSITMTLFDANGNEVDHSADFWMNKSSYNKTGSIEHSLNVEGLDEGAYRLEIEIN